VRRDAEHFGEQEVELVQISRALKEALRAETTLTSAGIDYFVESDNYRATLLLVIPVQRVGAFFYVLPQDAPRARDLLRTHGFTVTEVEE
jgi:hypothetical protein